jgi:hypothetical protein
MTTGSEGSMFEEDMLNDEYSEPLETNSEKKRHINPLGGKEKIQKVSSFHSNPNINHSSAVRIQAFVRGCICRQSVNEMVARLISELAEEEGAFSSSCKVLDLLREDTAPALPEAPEARSEVPLNIPPTSQSDRPSPPKSPVKGTAVMPLVRLLNAQKQSSEPKKTNARAIWKRPEVTKKVPTAEESKCVPKWQRPTAAGKKTVLENGSTAVPPVVKKSEAMESLNGQIHGEGTNEGALSDDDMAGLSTEPEKPKARAIWKRPDVTKKVPTAEESKSVPKWQRPTAAGKETESEKGSAAVPPVVTKYEAKPTPPWMKKELDKSREQDTDDDLDGGVLEKSRSSFKDEMESLNDQIRGEGTNEGALSNEPEKPKARAIWKRPDVTKKVPKAEESKSVPKWQRPTAAGKETELENGGAAVPPVVTKSDAKPTPPWMKKELDESEEQDTDDDLDEEVLEKLRSSFEDETESLNDQSYDEGTNEGTLSDDDMTGFSTDDDVEGEKLRGLLFPSSLPLSEDSDGEGDNDEEFLDFGDSGSHGSLSDFKPKSGPSSSLMDRIKKFNDSAQSSDDQQELSEYQEAEILDFAATQFLMHMSAVKFQALARGYLYRRRDFESMARVVEWLKKHRVDRGEVDDADYNGEDDDDDDNNEEDDGDDDDDEDDIDEGGADESPSLSFEERQRDFLAQPKNSDTNIDCKGMMIAVQWVQEHGGKNPQSMAVHRLLMHTSATKIQAGCRGYLNRKIDYKKMMRAMDWLREYRVERAEIDEPSEPEMKHLEKVWGCLHSQTWRRKGYTNTEGGDKSFVSIASTESTIRFQEEEEEEVIIPKANVKELLNTWKWLKAKSISSKAVDTKLSTHANGEMIVVDGEAKTAETSETKLQPQELVNLYNWMHQTGFSRSTVETFEEFHIPDGDDDVSQPGDAARKRAFEIGRDDSVEAGGAGVGVGLPKTRVFYDASVSAGGAGVGVGLPKTRVFYDASVSAGGAGVGVGLPKTRVFYDASVSAGGAGVGVGLPKTRVFYDASVSAGGAGVGVGAKKGAGGIVPVLNFKKLIGLWVFLEANGMAMNAFKEVDKDELSTDVAETGDIDEPSMSSSEDAETMASKKDESKQKPMMNAMANKDELSTGVAKTGGKEEPSMISSEGADTMASKNGESKQDPTMKAMVNYWTSSDKYFESIKEESGDSISEGSGPMEWIVVDDDNVNTENDKSSIGSKEVKESSGYWSSNRYRGSAVRKNGKSSSEGSVQDEPIADDTGSWMYSPSNNHMLNTLSWLEIKGIDLEKVEKDEPTNVDDVSETENSSSNGDAVDTRKIQTSSVSMKDMLGTLSWLKERGVSSFSTRQICDEQATPDQASTDDVTEMETEIAAIDSKKGPPTTSDMMHALAWLQRIGVDSKKANTTSENPAIEESTDAATNSTANNDPKATGNEKGDSTASGKSLKKDTQHMLYSLSWLNKHGFSLERATNKDADEASPSESSKSVPGTQSEAPLDSPPSKPGNKGPAQSVSIDDKSGTTGQGWDDQPSTKEMMNALNWLEKRGAPAGRGVPASEIATNEDGLMGEVDTKGKGRDAQTGTSMKDMEAALNWLKKRGIGVETRPRKDISQSGETSQQEISTAPLMDSSTTSNRPPGASHSDMSSAVKWLEKKGISVKSRKQNDPSGMPSASDMEQALNLYKEEDVSKSSADSTDLSKAPDLYKEEGVDQHDRSVASKSSSDSTDLSKVNLYKEEGVDQHDLSVVSKSSTDSTDLSNAANLYKEKGVDQHDRSVVSKSSADSTDLSKVNLYKEEGVDQHDRNVVSKSSADSTDLSTPPSTKDMETALSWLGNREKNASKNTKEDSEDPSERDTKKGTDAQNKGLEFPSNKDMENALSWLQFTEAIPTKGPQKDKKGKAVKHDDDSSVDSAPSPKDHGEKGTHKEKGSKKSARKKSKKKQPSSAEMEKARKWLQKTEGKSSKCTATETAGAPSTEDMENTLKWLQRKEGKPGSTRKNPSNLYPVKKATSSTPLSPSKKTARKKNSMEDDPAFMSALRWLTSKKANRIEDIVYFKKLDSILPAKEGQSMEARAKEMVRAMKWVKQKGLELGRSTHSPAVDKSDELEKSQSSSPAVEKSQSSSLAVDKSDELEKSQSSSPAVDKSDELEKSQSSSPAVDKSDELEKSQSSSLAIDKSDELEKSQSSSPAVDKSDELEKSQSSSLAVDKSDELEKSQSSSPAVDKSDELEKSQSSSLAVDKSDELEKSQSSSPAPQQSIRVDKAPSSDRGRNKSKSPARETSKSPDLNPSKNSERRPPPKSPGRRASSKSPSRRSSSKTPGRRVKSPSNIRRSAKTDSGPNSPKKSPKTEKVSSTKTPSTPKKEKVMPLPHKDKKGKFPSKAKKSQPVAMKVLGAHSSPEERDLNNAMVWLQNKDDEGIEDADYFKKLDSMLPQKPGQTQETRALEIVKALHWVRKTNGKKEEKPLDVQATKKKQEKEKVAKKLGKPGTSAATVMLDKDTENALKWLDGGNKDDVEDSIHFKKLDKMLPKKADQTSEERAVKMAKALKLLRKKGLDGGKKQGDAASKGSDKTDMENALAWLQGKGAGKDVEDFEDASYFKKLDNMLPKKASETDEDRAKAMVKMLGWLRKKGLNLGTARK